ncbi:MAG TPA: lysine 2,3-aminomutase [Candidatus Krumholzibacteria bacterium]|nr:lysine 2,3-aminomutase [Candidatus Krumholzibacteria bacterium]
MIGKTRIAPRKFRAFTQRDIDRIPQLRLLDAEHRLRMKAVATVLPFRVNEYVLDELIDWNHVPDDPMFQLTFPQEGMLAAQDLDRMVGLLRRDAPDEKIKKAAREIQMSLNPHPAGQMELNVPLLDGKPVAGLQHKYRETVLAFPSQGQTCHAYCTYCFRWAQFVGIDDLKFAARETEALAAYLKDHTEVQSLLFTGGDPMIMKTAVIRRYVEPLLEPEFSHLVSIRFGTKATAYWPYRFLTDPDADDLLRLFEEIRKAGRHVAVMAHYSHPRELETPVAQAAVRRILSTGAVIRCQAPLIRRVNDNAIAWSDMWRTQIALGAIPYYMFVERDTGPKDYFGVPLGRALNIFTDAFTRVSGLGRTVRGPSMSATPGKVLVDGVAEIHGEKVFVLKFLQARDPAWVNRPFFAKFDPAAAWLDDLEPAFGESEFFFTREMGELKRRHRQPAWGEKSDRRRSLVLFGAVEWE